MPVQINNRPNPDSRLHTYSHGSRHSCTKEAEIDASLYQLLAYYMPPSPSSVSFGKYTHSINKDSTSDITGNPPILQRRQLSHKPSSSSSQWKPKAPLWRVHQSWLGEDMKSNQYNERPRPKNIPEDPNSLLLRRNTLHNTQIAPVAQDLLSKSLLSSQSWKSVSFSDKILVFSPTDQVTQIRSLEAEEDDDSLFVDALED
ncbi:hypothetical protein CLU79DRAFT_776797 [Phycomyces nitens]|nr:hypothetical protein CLU79DRAFT_776797 [Phycomyces nitens]